jgi:hypothetical protein
MALDHITDHEGIALSNVVRQYRDADNLKALIGLCAGRYQDLEDAFWAVFSETIDNVHGERLDEYGRIVNQPREGRIDDTYRLWIKTRVKINRSSGTIPEIIDIFTALVNGTSSVTLSEEFPAAFTLTMGASTFAIDPVESNSILQKVKPAGVRAVFVSPTTADATSFACDPNGAGFGDSTNPSTGGLFATAL